MKWYIVYTMFDFSGTMANEDPDAKVVYLASDVDRLRVEARERVARYVMDYWSYTGAPISSAYEHADCILAEIFKEANE